MFDIINEIANIQSMENISYTKQGNKIIINASGEWNIGNIQEMESVLSEILNMRPELIAIRCSDLAGLDSTAIASLVKFLRKTKEFNTRLIFFDLSPAIQHTFDLMTLNKFFTIMSGEKFEEEFGS
ncbi:MAG: STAS domain-containing protein [Spirochaetes bacterium]|nr:STAS domain-containing protein [Spirochaetota bacterium]